LEKGELCFYKYRYLIFQKLRTIEVLGNPIKEGMKGRREEGKREG